MNDNTEQNELFPSSAPPADDADRSDGGAPRPAPPPEAETPVSFSSPPIIIDDGGEEEENPGKPAARLSRRAAPSIPTRQPHHHPASEPASEGACSEFGARVRALRLRSGLSLEDAAAETLIKLDYLRALEEGDFDALPASVYVTAYLRRVCRLYGADAAESDALVLQLHDHLSYEIPDVAAKVHDLETDEREQRKVRQILFGIIAAAVLFVLILVIAAVLLFAGHGRNTAPFDESILLRLQPRAELKLSILPAREPGQ